MKNKIGPAFPVVQNSGTTLVDYGVSKREYFAAHAMMALIVGGKFHSEDLLAERAYEYADAMERQGK